MINPFVICSTEELAALRAYVDRERWELQCQALGATLEQTREWESAALACAQTTLYPNSEVVSYLRRLAKDSLARGDGWPESVAGALQAENERQLRRLFPPGFFE